MQTSTIVEANTAVFTEGHNSKSLSESGASNHSFLLHTQTLLLLPLLMAQSLPHLLLQRSSCQLQVLPFLLPLLLPKCKAHLLQRLLRARLLQLLLLLSKPLPLLLCCCRLGCRCMAHPLLPLR